MTLYPCAIPRCHPALPIHNVVTGEGIHSDSSYLTENGGVEVFVPPPLEAPDPEGIWERPESETTIIFGPVTVTYPGGSGTSEPTTQQPNEIPPEPPTVYLPPVPNDPPIQRPTIWLEIAGVATMAVGILTFVEAQTTIGMIRGLGGYAAGAIGALRGGNFLDK
jgi:hypothetical protein